LIEEGLFAYSGLGAYYLRCVAPSLEAVSRRQTRRLTARFCSADSDESGQKLTAAWRVSRKPLLPVFDFASLILPPLASSAFARRRLPYKTDGDLRFHA